MNTSIEQPHDLKAVLCEAGPLSDSIQSIMQASSTAWSIGFEDGTMVLVEWIPGPPRVAMSASIGAFLVRPGSGISADQALHRADDALYAAKDAGRNRVHAADGVTSD